MEALGNVHTGIALQIKKVMGPIGVAVLLQVPVRRLNLNQDIAQQFKLPFKAGFYNSFVAAIICSLVLMLQQATHSKVFLWNVNCM